MAVVSGLEKNISASTSVFSQEKMDKGHYKKPFAGAKVWKQKYTQQISKNQQEGDNNSKSKISPSHTRENDVNFPPLLQRNDIRPDSIQPKYDRRKEKGKEIDEEGWTVQKSKARLKEVPISEGKGRVEGMLTGIVGGSNPYAVLDDTC